MGAARQLCGPAGLLLLASLLVVPLVHGGSTRDDAPNLEISATRIRRDLDGVTTVLLVPARTGKSAPPLGVLTKTARTFVQDGASTEYATQVLGTTLDNGRLYAKILSTSSRVFYDKEPVAPASSSPYLVYPSLATAATGDWRSPVEGAAEADDERGAETTTTLPEEANEFNGNDIFDGSEVSLRPSRVITDNLPTFTVKQESAARESSEDEQPKSFRPRVPKIFRPASAKAAPRKAELKPLATVTYHGFADFVTTVGDTVIVFSPSTAPAPVGRPATTIKGDATLRPDDGIAVLKIKPTSVIAPTEKKTETIHIRNRHPVGSFPNKGAIKSASGGSAIDLQPSSTEEPEATRTRDPTPSLPPKIGRKQPTGLIKVLDSTIVSRGTTTHYMSSIYGSYVGTNYAQITRTSSNVYFHPEDRTRVFEFNEQQSVGESQDSGSSEDLGTTIKDTVETTTENELGNDVIPQNQGRSIKGSPPKNRFVPLKNVEKQKNVRETLSTRLVPSTVYKTFTYYTTFFIPGKGQTSTSIRSRELVSSEVTLLTEVISPSQTGSRENVAPTRAPTRRPTNPTESSVSINDKQEVEEIQLIFKTIFTTFTYLTTFYDDSTTSVSSRKVTATNVITQTVDPSALIGVDVEGLIEKEVRPTKTADAAFTRSASARDEPTTEDPDDDTVTTTSSTSEESDTTDEYPVDEPKIQLDSPVLEPSPTVVESAPSPTRQLKTYFTTYTYFTTIIVDDETEIETSTQVVSNVVSASIQPTPALPATQQTALAAPAAAKSEPPPEILAYLEALNRQKSPEEALSLAKKVQEQAQATTTEETEAETTVSSEETTTESSTEESTESDDETTTTTELTAGQSSRTNIKFTSSSGGSTVLDSIDRRMTVPEDQELSETNHQDVEPAPTFLLQTSYTTYTYFTTMYNGDATEVSSRLKTVTNVVTETIKPTAAVVQLESKTPQPLTYFTTFTYWTTFIKGDETATTSREETVSNVVTPGVTDSSSAAVQLDVVKTYRPFVLATPVTAALPASAATTVVPSIETAVAIGSSEGAADNEIASPNAILKQIPTIKVNEQSSTLAPEPTTLYTTYTYFTTSYVGNSTILNSRLETVTSVSFPEDLRATPRAINGAVLQTLQTEELKPSKKASDVPITGLISTIRTSEVNKDTTTHFATDIYGTYIDGLYAQVVESSTSVQVPATSTSTASLATPVLPTGVLFLNEGSIVDADEVTTVYYTTRQIGTSINGLYAKVIESTSTTKVDEGKLATYSPVRGHRTGLVRLIKGHIESNDTTTHYQSKVIGTSIDGRYAQIIESTSSYSVQPTLTRNISPSSRLSLNGATNFSIAPSPAVVQSSLSEDHVEDEQGEDSENEENDGTDDDDDQKSKKKSRLTFSSRKRTSSAPPIRPFASRSRPTFNPKRKPQGATTITRSDITPTITATLAGKGSRFASSRGRATVSPSATIAHASSSRRFSGRRSSIPAPSSTSLPSRSRGAVRATPSSLYSTASSRRSSASSVRGSSIRPTNRSVIASSTRYRPTAIRPSSASSRNVASLVDDQEDNANEFTTATLSTEVIAEETGGEAEAVTTTESSRRTNNPLLRFRRPPNLRSTTPRPVATTTPRQRAANARQLSNRPVRPLVTPRTRTTPSGLPPRSLFGRKPAVEPTPAEADRPREELGEPAVDEISDNDYEGSESAGQERAQPSPQRTGRGRRIRRQTASRSSRFRRPTVSTLSVEDRVDLDSSREDTSTNSRYGARGRSLTGRLSFNNRDSSSEDYAETLPVTRSRAKQISTVGSRSTVKPNSGRQVTWRAAGQESPSTYKRPATSTSRNSNSRTRNTSSRGRVGTQSRYQDSSSRRSTSGSRNPSRSNVRGNNRRISSRSRSNAYDDYRDDFDGTITVTHYVPTEVTLPYVNSQGVTEKRQVITAHPSTEVVGPERYSTITNSDGQNVVVLGSQVTGTNFQGQLEVTRFVLHQTPTTKVTRTLTSAGGRKFSQPVVVPSTVYSVENVISTLRPSLPDNAPLANILLSQLLLGQLNPLAAVQPGAQQPTVAATPSTRYDTRATTYVTTVTKHRSTVIPLTFRGKEILTTLVDSSTDVVTATELVTDTVVVTATLPIAAVAPAQLNSLLLLLQSSAADPLFAAPLLTQSNALPGQVEGRSQPADLDYKPESYEDLSGEEGAEATRPTAQPESSVVTLYVSGRRPGEFSTILSTVRAGEESSTKVKREAAGVTELQRSAAVEPPVEFVRIEGSMDAHAPTQSLESVVGDVGRHISTSIST